ncbi:hypothetical protein ACNOYE_18455 [Nannocystaceae bacterium ST9]
MRTRIGLVALSLVLAPARAEAGPPSGDPDEGAVVEIEVDTKKKPRTDGWFPGLDDPRVQAYFRSESMVGDSLFDPPRGPEMQYPLVRAGLTIAVRGPVSAGERREARRWARHMLAERMASFESCYTDARQRNPIDASKISLRVTIDQRGRGPIAIVAGELGDSAGNDCLTGVLAFAKRGAPRLSAPVEVEVPVWFWMQTIR